MVDEHKVDEHKVDEHKVDEHKVDEHKVDHEHKVDGHVNQFSSNVSQHYLLSTSRHISENLGLPPACLPSGFTLMDSAARKNLTFRAPRQPRARYTVDGVSSTELLACKVQPAARYLSLRNTRAGQAVVDDGHAADSEDELMDDAVLAELPVEEVRAPLLELSKELKAFSLGIQDETFSLHKKKHSERDLNMMHAIREVVAEVLGVLKTSGPRQTKEYGGFEDPPLQADPLLLSATKIAVAWNSQLLAERVIRHEKWAKLFKQADEATQHGIAIAVQSHLKYLAKKYNDIGWACGRDTPEKKRAHELAVAVQRALWRWRIETCIYFHHPDWEALLRHATAASMSSDDGTSDNEAKPFYMQVYYVSTKNWRDGDFVDFLRILDRCGRVREFRTKTRGRPLRTRLLASSDGCRKSISKVPINLEKQIYSSDYQNQLGQRHRYPVTNLVTLGQALVDSYIYVCIGKSTRELVTAAEMIRLVTRLSPLSAQQLVGLSSCALRRRFETALLNAHTPGEQTASRSVATIEDLLEKRGPISQQIAPLGRRTPKYGVFHLSAFASRQHTVVAAWLVYECCMRILKRRLQALYRETQRGLEQGDRAPNLSTEEGDTPNSPNLSTVFQPTVQVTSLIHGPHPPPYPFSSLQSYANRPFFTGYNYGPHKQASPRAGESSHLSSTYPNPLLYPYRSLQSYATAPFFRATTTGRTSRHLHSPAKAHIFRSRTLTRRYTLASRQAHTPVKPQMSQARNDDTVTNFPDFYLSATVATCTGSLLIRSTRRRPTRMFVRWHGTNGRPREPIHIQRRQAQPADAMLWQPRGATQRKNRFLHQLAA
ncbi:hypothetical protein BKA62DRAFT_679568 [Auriculariales sp. MPI-PUGE-AT-0066]|nr:hypothetical protein BKA62DRAFT_679568 [Auriculariales sp. MPI-PUGE-AT-0066]